MTTLLALRPRQVIDISAKEVLFFESAFVQSVAECSRTTWRGGSFVDVRTNALPEPARPNPLGPLLRNAFSVAYDQNRCLLFLTL